MILILFLSYLHLCVSSNTRTSKISLSNSTLSTTQSYDIKSLNMDYPSTNTSFYDDCSLSFQLNLININQLYNILSSNTNLQNSIFYWLHSHIFLLIDTSFIYDITKYTDNFWNEYYLHLTTISNQTHNTISLSINICIDQIEIKQIIQTELTTDGAEIAAFMRHKLINHINTYYNQIITDNLSTNIIIIQDTVLITEVTEHTTSYITSTDKPSPSSLASTSINNNQNEYIFTEKMIYVGIIGVCMIIMALILMVFIVLCIKNKTSEKIEQVIKDIKSQQNNNNKNNGNNGMNFEAQKANDIISIDPIHINIPTHLVSIDTGLNRENILEDDDGKGSIVIERNKLALMPEANKMDEKELEELKLNIDDIFTIQNMQNRRRLRNVQSLSARSANLSQKHQNDEINIIYNHSNSKSVIIPNNDHRKQIKDNIEFDSKNDGASIANESISFAIKERASLSNSSKIRKYRNYPQRHSVVIARKQYAKRKVIENKRSQSKPNLNHIKKQKLKASYSSHTIHESKNKHNYNNKNEKRKYRNSAVFPLQHNRDCMRDVVTNTNIKHRRRHINKKKVRSMDVGKVVFDINDKINLNINNIPQPNSKSIDDIGQILRLNQWESEPSKSSTNGIIVGTPTTKGAMSQIDAEGSGNDNMSNSDAQSIVGNDALSICSIDINDRNIDKNVNVYKIVESNKDIVTLTQKIPHISKNIPIPPPPPPKQKMYDIINNKHDIQLGIPVDPMKSVHIKVEAKHKLYNEDSITNDLREDSKKEGTCTVSTNGVSISRNNSEENDLKFDGLSMIAIHSNHSSRWQPSF